MAMKPSHIVHPRNFNLQSRNKHLNPSFTDISNWATRISNIPKKTTHSIKPTKISPETMMLNIFIFHSEFSEIDCEFYISYMNIYQIYKNAIKHHSKIKFSQIEIILKQINPIGNKINYSQFSKFILNLVIKIDPINSELNLQKASNFIINKVFREYYEKIMNKQIRNTNNYIEIDRNIKNTPINEAMQNIIGTIFPSLKHIYFSYFKYEVNNYTDKNQITKKSLKAFIEFSKHYGICPFYYSIAQIAMYFYLIIDDSNIKFDLFNGNNYGKIFTMNKFCTVLVIIGINMINGQLSMIEKGEDKINSAQEIISNYKSLTNEEKLIKFFSKIQLGKGIEHISRKKNLTMNLSVSQLMPSDDILNMINPNLNMTFTRTSYHPKTWKSSTVAAESSFFSSASNIITNTTCKLTSPTQDKSVIIHKFDKYNPYLKSMFSYYTNATDKLQFTQMGLSDFIKLLKDFGIIKGKKPKRSGSQKMFPSSNISNNCSYNLHLSRKDSTNTYTYYTDINTVKDYSFDNLKKLDENSIGVLFANLTREKKKGNSVFESISSLKGMNESYNIQNKMNYVSFLKAMEIIALKIYSDNLKKNKISTDNMSSSDAIAYLFENEIYEQIQIFKEKQKTKNEIINKLNLIKEGKIYDILNVMKTVIKSYYNTYAIDGLLTFDTYFKMYRDFWIFPEMSNLIEIKNIFFTLAEQKEIEEYNNSFIKLCQLSTKDNFQFKPINEKNINFELFMFSLGIVGLSLDTTIKLSDIEKVTLLFEKIGSSTKKDKTQEETGITL